MLGRPRTAKCGTDTGYAYHVRHKEKTCAMCKQAHNKYQRYYNQQRKGQ